MLSSLTLLLGQVSDSGAWQQIARFWSFQDPAVRTAAVGVLLLATSCGSLGCFIVLRKLSLMGDSLGHAVLPGVCFGFLVTWTKDPFWIFLGAVLSALVGSWLIGFVQRHSRLKPDAAMGLVLSGFFGLGIVLLTRLQSFSAGSQSGLNQFLFGQASAISEKDLWLVAILSAVILGSVGLAFKELALTSFDEGFAGSLGLPIRTIHYLLMGLTALAIVISIQAVGVVLLSALLITPAATALLLTDRLRIMVLLAVVLACTAGMLGLNLSFLNRNLPTGPFIVVALSFFFVTAYLFGPRYGIVTRGLRRRARVRRTARENVLKSIYLAMRAGQSAAGERGTRPANAQQQVLLLKELAEFRNEPATKMHRLLRPLIRHRWVEIIGDAIRLTDLGQLRASELDRNYRLWEAFLTNEIHLPFDHTQRDAEDIEHILGPDLVHELEARYETHP